MRTKTIEVDVCFTPTNFHKIHNKHGNYSVEMVLSSSIQNHIKGRLIIPMETKIRGGKVKTKTIEVSRWVNIYGEPVNGVSPHYLNKALALEATKCNSYPLLATVELKGSYEIEVPDRAITITESELREALHRFVPMPSFQERVDSVITKVFGGEE